MSDPITINNDDGETVEVSTAEYEAIIGFSAKLAEQNMLVLESQKLLRDEMVAQAENLAAMFASLVDAIRAIQIVNNIEVPPVPAPVVNMQVPQQPAPDVTVEIPPEKKRKVKLDVRRNANGAITGVEGTAE